MVAADRATLFGTAEFVNDFIRAAVKGLEAVVLALAASSTATALRQFFTASPWKWFTGQAYSRWGRWTVETLIPAPYLVALTIVFACSFAVRTDTSALIQITNLSASACGVVSAFAFTEHAVGKRVRNTAGATLAAVVFVGLQVPTAVTGTTGLAACTIFLYTLIAAAAYARSSADLVARGAQALAIRTCFTA